MRLMLVAPGPFHSTFDVYKYYLDAARESNDLNSVQGFNFHNMMVYHQYATNKFFEHYGEDQRNTIAASHAARELILDVLMFKPDFVMFISGTLIPFDVYAHLLDVRYKLQDKFGVGIYLTECPYIDQLQSSIVRFSDVLFINDKYSLKTFDPKGNHYVEYLPHSYSPKVHYPGKVDDEKYGSQIMFCGTPFYERVEKLSSVDWSGINFRLVGNKDAWLYEESGYKLEDYLEHKNITNNYELAEFYRGTEIALNIHRTRETLDSNEDELDNYKDAYSIGPRLYEAAACEAFILTDYRKEAEDLFGDTIEFFDNTDEMKQKIDYWLDPEHEEERRNKARAARQKVQYCTFDNRLKDYVLPVFNDVLSLRRDQNG